MYERRDVPKPDKNRTKKAIIILIVLFAIIVGGLFALWQLVLSQSASNLASDDLVEAVSTDQTQPAATSKDLKASSDSFDHMLLLVVNEAKVEHPKLQQVRLITINQTKQKGIAVDIPVKTDVGNGQSLSDAFSKLPRKEVIKKLSSTLKVPFTHVIVLDEWLMDVFMNNRSMGATALVSNMGKYLKHMETDMSAASIVSYMEKLHGIGISHLKPTEDGTYIRAKKSNLTSIDTDKLGLLIGTLQR